jgi:hypothetical protein
VLAAPPSQGDSSVGLLLHDTCAGAPPGVCSRLGRMFMPGFASRNDQKALRASKAYCAVLGTPWECRDARDRVLRQRPPDLASAAAFAEGACSAGSPRGCVLWAQALGAAAASGGREEGPPVLRRECEQAPQACLELANWLDFRCPGGAGFVRGPGERDLRRGADRVTNGRVERAGELRPAPGSGSGGRNGAPSLEQ